VLRLDVDVLIFCTLDGVLGLDVDVAFFFCTLDGVLVLDVGVAFFFCTLDGALGLDVDVPLFFCTPDAALSETAVELGVAASAVAITWRSSMGLDAVVGLGAEVAFAVLTANAPAVLPIVLAIPSSPGWTPSGSWELRWCSP
jgi:hypothetical protein